MHEDGRAFDLATGARVTLIVGSAGGVSEQLRWIARCDTLRALHHRAIAPLVDFGLVGESSRFEAWRCGSARVGDGGRVAARSRDAVAARVRPVGGAARAGCDQARCAMAAGSGFPIRAVATPTREEADDWRIAD